MELKTLNTKDIEPNYSQPRENFDGEKLQELAESILSNGLINPITVRKDGKKYTIVAGERRWTAHKLAKLKQIAAFVKEYKDDGQWMVESLIENVHRENLQPLEKAKYLKKIMEMEKIPNLQKLSERVKMHGASVRNLFDEFEIRKEVPKEAKSGVINETQVLEKKDRKKLIEKAVKNDLGQRKIREEVKVIKKAPEEVKSALLDDKITTEQAERISKLKTKQQREKAIKEHQILSKVKDNVEKHVEAEDKPKVSQAKVMKAGNWITALRGDVEKSRDQLEKTIKTLMKSTTFTSLMNDNQKTELEDELDDFIEILTRGEQLSQQIKQTL